MATKVSKAFTFAQDIERQISNIATVNGENMIDTASNIIAVFALLGYDGSKRNIPGKEWERVQTVYAAAFAAASSCTVEHAKKTFRRNAIALGYGKLQTAAARKLQAERNASKPTVEKSDAGESDTLGKAALTIAAAIRAFDNGNPQAARELLVSMLPSKARKALTLPVAA